MLKRAKKEEIVKELETAVKDAESVVFVNFHGLSVADETKLRRELREQGVKYKVGRKTLLARALQGKAEGEVPILPGEVAIAYLPAEARAVEGGADQLAPARGVHNFGAAHGGILGILGGIFGGKFVGAERMNEIAMIPSREVLYAQFANLLNSPIRRLVVALDQITKSKKSHG